MRKIPAIMWKCRWFERLALEKRARYYRSQMDMDLLLAGESYENLPDTYVIFICDFDLFGAGRYRYTFENCCLEDLNQKTGGRLPLYFFEYLWRKQGRGSRRAG